MLTYDYKPLQDHSAHIVEGYMTWFIQLTEITLSPKKGTEKPSLDAPPNITQWIAQKKHALQSTGQDLSKLIQMQASLISLAGEMMATIIETNKTPSPAKFSEFTTLFNQFITILNRVNHNSIGEEYGFDVTTKLKNYSALISDFNKELTRLERNGQEFSLALIGLNAPDAIKKNEAHFHDLLRSVTKLINNTFRTYDDAYYIGDGHFVVLMKQATKGISSIIVSRIVSEFSELDFKALNITNDQVNLASCVAQPVPGEKIEDLLLILKEEINVYASSSGGVLEHKEISLIEKYAQSKQSTHS